MKILPEKLSVAIQQHLQHLYLVSGDEALLVNECIDQIRLAAHQQGFAEREVFHAESGTFDWEPFLQSANSLSLFSEKKLLEVRSSKKNLSDEKFLAYWKHPNPDIVILVILEKIDKATLGTQWFSSLEQAGTLVQVWPLDADKMLDWLSQRARKQGLQIGQEAAQILRDRTDGNLLAAAQELDKLHLLYGDTTVSAEQISDAVTDSARYDVFKLMDAILGGNAVEVVRILQSLYEEGTVPIAIMSILLLDLRILTNTSEAVQQGQSVNSLLFKQGVWEQRQSLFQKTLKRHSTKTFRALLQRASRIDLSIKGMDNLNPQDALENLCLALAGKKVAA
jgi:DNA polymerase-3 subunit delta